MPRFVVPGEPEHEVCLHWKVLFDSQKKKEDDLKREIDEARDTLLKESGKTAKEQESHTTRKTAFKKLYTIYCNTAARGLTDICV